MRMEQPVSKANVYRQEGCRMKCFPATDFFTHIASMRDILSFIRFDLHGLILT